MLSIEDIKNISFRRSNFGGYKPEDVDNFIDSVEESYSRLLSDKAKLLKEVEELNAIVSKYKEEEGSIRSAILAAQKLADNSIKEAKAKAESIINNAKLNVEKEKVASKEIYIKIDKFKNKLLDMYNEHIELIKSMPSKNVETHETKESPENKKDSDGKVCINKADLENAIEAKKLSAPKEEISFSEENCIDSGRSEEPANEKKKFENLKFGSDYAIKSEKESKKKLGFFRRRK